MDSRRSGDLYALACAVVCGLGNIPTKVALNSVSAELFNVYYFIFAFILSGLALFKKNERQDIARLNKKIAALIFLLSVIFALAIYLSMAAMKMIEPATVSFLSRFEVIVTVALAYMILKERLNGIEILGGFVAIIGLVVLKYETNIVISRAATLMVLSSFLFAAAEIIVKKNISQLGTGKFLFYRNLFALPTIYAILLLRGEKLMLPDNKTLFLIFSAALLLPVLGRATYMEALRRTSISRTTIITQLTPLVTALFAFLILSSLPAPIEWLGGGLIVFGVAIARLSEIKWGSDNRRLP